MQSSDIIKTYCNLILSEKKMRKSSVRIQEVLCLKWIIIKLIIVIGIIYFITKTWSINKDRISYIHIVVINDNVL